MDPYQSPDSQSDEAIAAMTTRLEDRGTNEDFQEMISDYLFGIPQDEAVSVLDLGWGTGVVTRRLEEHLSQDSRLVGADISERFLKAAAEFSQSDFIRWERVPEGRLPYEDESYDFVILHTVMSHVPDPVATLAEAGRVLKRGGRLIVFDADYASTTYGYPDFEKMREIDHKLLAAVAANLDVCRQMPRYLVAAGLVMEGHEGYLISEAGEGDFWLSSVQGFAKLIPALGILPPKEGEAWVNHMLRSHDEGTFFAASSYYTFVASKAGGDLRQAEI